MLPIDKAIPCGLLVNELLTNSFKHAFPEGQGEIRISFFCVDNKITLTVEDSGVGFRKDPALALKNTLGMSLINALAVQLNGSLVFETDQGVKCVIVFELESDECVS